MNKEKLVILGSGPAGLTAGIYAARAGLEPLIVEGKSPGGQLMNTTHVENWPGNISILGPELMKQMREHAAHFGAKFLSHEIVNVDFSKEILLTSHRNKVVNTKSLIITTGTTSKKLNCPGEEFYWNKGVTTCAVCDGAFYKNQPVVIIGGGDTAMEIALFMTNFTTDITIVHILEKFTASKAMADKVLARNDIKCIYNSTAVEIIGNQKYVSGVIIESKLDKSKHTLECKAVFVAIGLSPNTAIFKGHLKMNNYGYIELENFTETSKPGIFAAGDVVDYRYKQAITSAGSGCMASLDAERYLKELGY